MKQTFTLTVILFLLISGAAFSQSTFTFTGKPTYEIVTKRAGNYLGTIHIELFPNIALHHTENFDSLVSTHFYDTTAFHRVVPGFVIQGGDPNSRHGAVSTWGFGQPGQPTVDAEFSVAKHIRGRLSAARSANINSATSQFFICVATAANLDTHYSLYGQVTSGMNIVDSIVNSPRYPSTYTDTPLQKIEMFVTRVGSNDSVPQAPSLMTPVNGTVNVDTGLVHMKWNAVHDAIIYHIQVATDSLFNDTIYSRDTSIINCNLSHLNGNTFYYWRVRVNNGGHFSDYSPVWKFHTKGETTGLPVISLTGGTTVFPNPTVNGKFNFSNTSRGDKIEVVDMNGKPVYEIIVSDTNTTIDLGRKDKGEYFYKISSNGKKTQSGKLIVQ